MKRRIFLRHLSALTIGSLLPLSGCQRNQAITFGICADVHKDLIPDAHAETRAYMPADQLNWLKNDLGATNKPTIIFSHQGLELKDGVHNQKEVRHLLETSGKVIACFAGHHHTDLHSEINNIHYLQINSMSYQWVGEKYKCDTRYEGTFNRSYPSLKYTAPYQDPLFALVKVYPDGRLLIDGVQSVFMSPTPDELGAPANLHGIPLTASIGNRELSFTAHSKLF